MLFKIFVSTMDSRIECTPGKFVNRSVDTEERDAIQSDLDRLGRCAHVNLMKFNQAKGLNVGQGNPKHKYRQGRDWIESSPEEKGLVDTTGQCALTAHKASHQPHPELNQKNCGHKVKGADSALLLCCCEIAPGVLHQVLKPSAQEFKQE